ncbi:MAG TPA: ethanolamine ammonia-lyase reactivating factor EutA [Pirellulales bacterium]|nr:ethanolamine ammonia-lyase reactivating factor EutA [Pirellulales bacterium]
MPTGSSTVRLIGLDFGSTTTSGVVARARLHGGADRRSELSDVVIEYRSEPIFTPFRDSHIDEQRLADWLDNWLRAAGIAEAEIAAGGALVTGLAAQTQNAGLVRQLVRERFGETLVATADDPALESWLAFMANCRELSLAEPDARFLNFDIGGGTTNVALGQAGQVQAVGCYNIGARHVRFEPGTYRIAGLSEVGRRLLADLKLPSSGVLNPADVTILVEFLARRLEALVQQPVTGAAGTTSRFAEAGGTPAPPCRYLDSLVLQAHCSEFPVVTLSGGVGELAYHAALGDELPGVTAYGDLGVDLARRICNSPILSKDLRTHTPAALGRATVLGLAIHHMQLSGATLFLPDSAVLPLAELPIVGRLDTKSSEEEIAAILELVSRSHRGACLAIELPDPKYQTVRSLGTRLAAALEARRLPPDRPLVLLVNQNVGKTLGQYATRWRRLPVTLIVLDELPDELLKSGAAFATLGRPRDQVVPVSFYGL